jgi:hypothetical protein
MGRLHTLRQRADTARIALSSRRFQGYASMCVRNVTDRCACDDCLEREMKEARDRVAPIIERERANEWIDSDILNFRVR